LSALCLAAAGCGHQVTASSPHAAARRGAEICRPLHDRLETILREMSDTATAAPNAVSRAHMVGTLVNALDSDSGYTRKADLTAAFGGCVRAAWTPDLGPVPAAPRSWGS
jgi:hypothetical protein